MFHVKHFKYSNHKKLRENEVKITNNFLCSLLIDFKILSF